MRHISVVATLLAVSPALAQSSAAGPYRVLNVAKVGGDGGFDYVAADSANRKLYVPRTGAQGQRVSIFDLDTLTLLGEVPAANAHGVAIDRKSGHAFASSKPVAMWDAKTLKPIKTIEVQGNPDGILADPFNGRILVLSHAAPNVTVIDAADGNVVGTIDIGGAPEQAVTDGAGHIYIDVEDKDQVAAIDAKTMTVTAKYDLKGQGGTPAGLAFDVKNNVLFVACRKPATMVMLDAASGAIIGTVPLGTGTDGAVFNPATGEAFSSQTDGTLTVVKEANPKSFAVEQTVQTMPTAKTLTLDAKTGHIILIAAQFEPAPEGSKSPRGPMVPGSFSILTVGR
jgi:DNA-binding beta-propeller fold protein YncE